MGAPLVSVVVPTHHRPALLARAVGSALSQTLDDLEVIVVDDASTDDTPAALAALAALDGRVRSLALRTAGGAPAARNAGIDAASGRYVAFLDDDDEWLPTKLERQVALLEAEADVVLASCHHELVTHGGAAAYRGPTSCTRDELFWCDFLGGSSLGMVRREAFEQGLPRFDEGLPTCQDWDYWVRCAVVGEVAVVPEVLCRYTADGSDRLTNDLAKRLLGHERFAQRHAGAMSEHCRAYHRARRALMAAPARRAQALLGPRLLATLPPRVSWILAREIVAARAGAAVGDPGRGMRALHRSIAGRA